MGDQESSHTRRTLDVPTNTPPANQKDSRSQHATDQRDLQNPAEIPSLFELDSPSNTVLILRALCKLGLYLLGEALEPHVVVGEVVAFWFCFVWMVE